MKGTFGVIISIVLILFSFSRIAHRCSRINNSNNSNHFAGINPQKDNFIDDETMAILGIKRLKGDTFIKMNDNAGFILRKDFYILTNLTSDKLLVAAKKDNFTFAIHRADKSNTDIAKQWEQMRKENINTAQTGQKLTAFNYADNDINNTTVETREYLINGAGLNTVGIAKLFEAGNERFFIQLETSNMKGGFQKSANKFLEDNLMLQ